MKRRFKYWYFALVVGFLIGNYRGYIALWENEEKEPLRVFPYSVTSLPPDDQEKVNTGIRIRSEDELKQIMEDFLS